MKLLVTPILPLLLCASLFACGQAYAQTTAVLSDLGPMPPEPGGDDIVQVSIDGDTSFPAGLNYYMDNGSPPGQTFMTGDYPGGYTLGSVAVQTGDREGGGILNPQQFQLRIYAVSGNLATLVESYVSQNDFILTPGNWLQWTGLVTTLAPNTSYAYTMRCGSGWEGLRNTSSNPYAGGSIALIPQAGGPINFGNNTEYDAAFIVGLSPLRSPVVFAPTVSPGPTVYTGTPVTLGADALGETPLSYQWQTDGGSGTLADIPGAVEPDLVVDTTGLLGAHQFVVVVGNAYGSEVSPVATVTILPPSGPIIQQDTTPAAVTRFAGTTVTFDTVVVGSLPITYEWRHDGAPVPGATNASLTLSPLTTDDAGEYVLHVSNAYGSESTTPATLSVLPVDADSYAEMLIGNQPAAYWRLNETAATAFDYVGGHDITHNANVLSTPGLRQPDVPGFEAANNAMFCNGTNAGSSASGSLLNGMTTYTLSGWFRPDVMPQGDRTALFGENNIAEFGFHYGDLGIYVVNGGTVMANAQEYGIVTGQWFYAAAVRDLTETRLYLNGDLVATTRGSAVLLDSDSPFRIGYGVLDNSGNWFNGAIDEVAVFDYALSNEAINALYAAGVGPVAPLVIRQPSDKTLFADTTAGFSVQAGGTLPFSYQWMKDDQPLVNGDRISGADAASLSIDRVTAEEDAGAYSVVISNAAGIAVSLPAQLIILPPPSTLGPYAQQLALLSPFAHWTLNEAPESAGYDEAAPAPDYWGGHDGTYGLWASSTLESQALRFPGFTEDNAGVYLDGYDDSWVVLPILPLNTATLTVCGWIKIDANQNPSSGIFFTRDGSNAGGLHLGSDGRELRYTWNNSPETSGWSSGLTVPANVWTFVALVVEPERGTLYMGTESLPLAAATNQVANAAMSFIGTTYIGNDTGGIRSLYGFVDEVSVFDRALTLQQVQSLFDAAFALLPVKLGIERPGPNTITLTWPAGILQGADDPTDAYSDVPAAVSPFSPSPTGPRKFFRVRMD